MYIICLDTQTFVFLVRSLTVVFVMETRPYNQKILITITHTESSKKKKKLPRRAVQ